MYTNPNNILKTAKNLIERNALSLNRIVSSYQGDSHSLTVLSGIRKVVPVDLYPCLEIEPSNSSNRWATTRAQRPKYNFRMILTVKVDNEDYGVEYITTITTAVVEILTSPENLQLLVVDETKWDFTGGLMSTYIMDSLVEGVEYSASKSGSLRRSEFDWFAEIHEPYPDAKWAVGGALTPTIIRPIVITL